MITPNVIPFCKCLQLYRAQRKFSFTLERILMKTLSTGQVADLLGVNLHRLDYLTRDRQIRPQKGPTGIFMWTYENVTFAARLIQEKPPSEDEFLQVANVGA